MSQDLKCPKCQSEMIQGFVKDSRSVKQKGWTDGQVKQSWLGGALATLGRPIPIAVFRCQGCGYLEFYADEKFAVR